MAPRGERKSPYIGKTADPACVLYPQFTSVASVLLEGEEATAAAPTTAAAPPPAPEEPRTSKRGAQDSETAAPAGDGDGAAVAVDAPAPKKKRRKPAKGSAGAPPSGPGNAEEAARMRAALGFQEAAAAAAPVAAAPAAAPPPSTFAFGFPVAAAPDAPDVAAPLHDATVLPPPPPLAADPPKRERRPRGGRAGAAAAAAAASANPLARRVFVGGMPFAFEEDDVREYWEWCGEVASLDLMRFPDTGRFRGIAFITFATDDGYAKALECDGTLLEGVRVKVEPCKTGKRGQGGAPGAPAPAPSPHAGPAPKTPGYNVAYVGNVAFEAGPEDVAALFGEGGGVARVRLHTDKMTGRSRGYAHVHFVSEAALDAAVSGVDGAELMGRAVRVSYAQAKKEKEVEAEA